jgi:hypothetical protein
LISTIGAIADLLPGLATMTRDLPEGLSRGGVQAP